MLVAFQRLKLFVVGSVCNEVTEADTFATSSLQHVTAVTQLIWLLAAQVEYRRSASHRAPLDNISSRQQTNR